EEMHGKHRDSTFLYREALLYIPQGSRPQDSRSNRPGYGGEVLFDDIADETFVLVPDACGLARTMRELFRSHRRTLREYSGEAMSYQVLEQWAELGIGSAMLPRSKLSADQRRALRIKERNGQYVEISFEAVWNSSSVHAPHLMEFVNYLREVLP